MENKIASFVQWQSLLNTCKQMWVNTDFTEARWPLGPVADDENDWETVEHFFPVGGTLEEGLRQLDELVKKGEIRLLTGSRRAMEYIAAHLDAQSDHPIFLPLRARRSDGRWVVPVFTRFWCDERLRDLDLYCLDGEFRPVCGWLVLRKRTSVTG